MHDFSLTLNDKLVLTELPADLLLWNDDLTRWNILCVRDWMIQNADGTNNLNTRITKESTRN